MKNKKLSNKIKNVPSTTLLVSHIKNKFLLKTKNKSMANKIFSLFKKNFNMINSYILHITCVMFIN